MTRFALSDLSPDQQLQARAQLGLSTIRIGDDGSGVVPRLASDVVEIVPRGTFKPRKYRNQPVEIDGKRFDSKLEGRCYSWLVARSQTGDISWFTRQVNFELPGGIKYRADFLAALKGGGIEVIDAKGFLVATSHMKIKQMKALYGIDVILWSDRPKAGM